MLVHWNEAVQRPLPVQRTLQLYFTKHPLVVHPLSCCRIWHDGTPGAARSAVPPSTAPDEGMLVLVPVRGGPLGGFFDLGPGLEATPFEGQRAQDLPPRLDQVQVGRVFGLKHELPAR